MEPRPQLSFEPFRLDPDNACLWRGSEAVPLKPKAFAVLQCLVEHAGRLMTKEVLLQSVWPDSAVSDAVLKVCISEIRKAMDDTAEASRFIVTVHRRGYRFVAPVAPVATARSGVGRPPRSMPPAPPVPLVGREVVLGRLHGSLAAALRGERQVVFVTGEPGIGKTATVDAFLAQAAVDPALGIVRGQCVELYGSAEPYLPVLDALGRLCREPEGEALTALLRQHAPSWLVQMPGLVRLTDRDALPPEFLGATRDRMLREMVDLVDVLTGETPLVLVLEDLHWSDGATVDLVSALARRREPARLLVIGTFRPVDLIVEGHPLRGLKQELSQRGYCDEIPLEPLSQARVVEYLGARFPGTSVPAELAQIIHERTDGNPLFMVNTVDHLIKQGWLVQREGKWVLCGTSREIALEVPEGIREMIENQFEQLSPEDQRLLEAGSVVGVEFSAAAVAAVLEADPVAVEERCDGLARQPRFLRGAGTATWPDGTDTGRYGFLHSLYQGVVYRRLAPGARRRLHQRVGERIEAAYAHQTGDVAAELVLHFEQAGDIDRTVRYLRQAANNAVRRYAGREAIGYLTRGLERVGHLPDTPDRIRLELDFQTALGSVFVATKGHAAPEVERTYSRARTLCHELGERAQLFPVLCGLGLFHLQRAELQTAYELGAELFDLARGAEDPLRLVLAHRALGTPLLWLGELGQARTHLEAGIAAAGQSQDARATLYGEHPAVTCLCYLARVLWTQGYPDQAVTRIDEALALAGELDDPFSLAYAQSGAAFVYQLRREAPTAQRWAQAAATIASDRGFPFVLTWANILGGAALTAQGQLEEGMTQLTRGLAAHRDTGGELGRPYYLTLLAEAHQRRGQPAEGLKVLAEAETAAQRDGERAGEAERHRLKGELLLLLHGAGGASPPPGAGRSSVAGAARHALVEAETCFRRAIETADRQGALSWALRATISLSRLWQRQGRRAEAFRILTASYASFSEGFGTPDLQDAKVLLREIQAGEHPPARKAPGRGH